MSIVERNAMRCYTASCALITVGERLYVRILRFELLLGLGQGCRSVMTCRKSVIVRS